MTDVLATEPLPASPPPPPARRGRPRLDIPIDRLLAAVRKHRIVVRAAHELGCSEAYVRMRLKGAGLNLGQALGAESDVSNSV